MPIRLTVTWLVAWGLATVALAADAGRAGLDWWSLQPIVRPQVPDCDSAWVRNPIDAFVLRDLDVAGLSPSPEADRATLIRRLSFDLTGLPPTPTAIREFLADSDPLAYERLVNRLLRSPHYGERWARHWFDVVRFGETNGFEYNQPRENAWPYKNWVIEALNHDVPYDEFVRLQIAGDVLTDSAAGIVATGFLVAGPHNTTLPSSDKMKKTMRQDEMEDLVATISQTFLGITANCGRCHDHKFDPITQQDYYRLVAALAGVKHGEREYVTDRVTEARRQLARLDELRSELARQLGDIEAPARRQILAARGTSASKFAATPQPLAAWNFDGTREDSQGPLHAAAEQGAGVLEGGLRVDGTGFARTLPVRQNIREKTLEAWVRLDNLSQRGGAAISLQSRDGATFDAIVFGERKPGRWMAGSNGFTRTKPFGGEVEHEAIDRPVHFAITYDGDGTITGYRDGQPYGHAYQAPPPPTYRQGESELLFGLRHAPPGEGRMLRGWIRAARLYDRALSAEEVAASAAAGPEGISTAEIMAALGVPERAKRAEILKRLRPLTAARAELAEQVKPAITYTSVSGNAPVVRRLERGDVTAESEVMRPGGIAALDATHWDFELPADAEDGPRRRKLAQWITEPANPLFARVIANRLWHHHFGRGIVATPNDFGYNGARPSHPELLDWLAAEIPRQGWSLKAMHRLIVSSATYRQESRIRPDAATRDADNRWLWRMTPRRLEGEAIRDALLAVAGRLELTLGGPPYRDVRHYEYRGSNFYDPIESATNQPCRRTVYRFSPRGARRTMLDTLDCPDPSATTPNRAVTTTPLQALALLNNALVLQLADAFAARLESQQSTLTGQVTAAYALTYGREPTTADLETASEFIQNYGLTAFCRVLFNTNEFLYVR